MRVALIVPGGVDRSGTERVIPALLWLVERLARRHELVVHAVAQEPRPSTYPLLGATVVNLGAGPSAIPGGRFAAAYGRLVDSLRAGPRPDVLHAFWAETPGLLAAAAGRRLGIPWVVSLGGGELASIPEIAYGSARTLRGRLRTRLALAGASRVTAASRFLRDKARAAGFTADEVPLGVDASWLGDPRRAPPGPPWRLLHIGSLNRVKDQSTLLHALRHVAAEEPTVRLDIAGDDNLAGAVEREAAALGVAGRVAFHGALLPGAVRDLVAAAHLLVVSSRHEAGPVAVLEAAALAVPTAGTAVGHVADFAPELAAAVPVGDARALGRAIVELLRDTPRREAMGRRARAFAVAHDADATARAFEAIYDEAAARRHARRSRR